MIKGVYYILKNWIEAPTKDNQYRSLRLHSNQKSSNAKLRLDKLRLQVRGPTTSKDPACVTASDARVAYRLSLPHSKVCESFNRVVDVILDSAKSPNASIRCRSLKVVLQILEADSLLINRAPAIKNLISGRTRVSQY